MTFGGHICWLEADQIEKRLRGGMSATAIARMHERPLQTILLLAFERRVGVSNVR